MVAATAAATATGALVCAAGCVLPFALPAAALAGAGGVLAWFAEARSWMMLAAIIAVTCGWLWVGWQTLASKVLPAGSTLAAMAVASLALGAAIAWPTLEPDVVRLLLSSRLH